MRTASDIILSLDWVGLSLRLNSQPSQIEGHIWREYSATNVWSKRRVLYNKHGERVCTLLSEPRSKIISSNAALLEIENEWLYHGLGVDGVLDKLRSAAWFEVLGFSRLDLAVDFTPTETQEEVIKGLASGKYYVAGKQNGSGFWSTNSNVKFAPQWRADRIPHCQSWGHKTSSIKWKLYYKTKELADAGGGRFFDKPYIIDRWKEFNLDVSNVWRLEVSLKHGNGFQYDGVKLNLDTIRESRDDIFAYFYDTRFQIRENQGHKDKTNDKKVNFLDVRRHFTAVTPTPAKKLAEHNGRITLVRHLVKSLEDEQVLLDAPSRRGVINHIREIIRRDGLDNYFRAMTELWFEDWAEDIEKKAAEGWNGRDNIACPPNEEKGSHAANGRTFEAPRRQICNDIHPNSHFDDTLDDNLKKYWD